MTRRVILRLGRRRTAWEKTSAREIAEIEFPNRAEGGLDLNPSVYVLEAPTDEAISQLAVRVRAEHSASFLQPPKPAGTLELDLEGLLDNEPVACAGNTRFQFANSAHAELRLGKPEALIAIVQSVLDQLATRARTVSLREILEYVDAQVGARDPEWLALVGARGAETGPWGEALATFKRKH